MRFAGEQRLIAAEDAGRYRDAVGVMPPGGLPEVFLEGAPDSLEQLVLRYARGRGPFTTAQANERFGRDVEPLLQQLERQEQLLRGELRPGGTEREWCDPDVLRRLRRASLAALRKEVEPVDASTLGRFLPAWQGAAAPSGGPEALPGYVRTQYGRRVALHCCRREELGHVTIARTRNVSEGMEDRMVVRSHAARPLAFSLEVELATDFATRRPAAIRCPSFQRPLRQRRAERVRLADRHASQ